MQSNHLYYTNVREQRVVFLLRAGVCFPRGDIGLPFFVTTSVSFTFLSPIFEFILDTFSHKWYNINKSYDLRKRNRIRGDFIHSFAETEQERNQNDLSDEVCFWLFFVVKPAPRTDLGVLKILQRGTYLCQKKTQPLTSHGLTK